MKRTRIRPISSKQSKELKLRRQLKVELIEQSHGLCMHCGNPPDIRGLALVHVKSLAQGGKTERDNNEVWCYPCHGSGIVGGHKTEMPPGWAASKPEIRPLGES